MQRRKFPQHLFCLLDGRMVLKVQDGWRPSAVCDFLFTTEGSRCWRQLIVTISLCSDKLRLTCAAAAAAGGYMWKIRKFHISAAAMQPSAAAACVKCSSCESALSCVQTCVKHTERQNFLSQCILSARYQNNLIHLVLRSPSEQALNPWSSGDGRRRHDQEVASLSPSARYKMDYFSHKFVFKLHHY